jgi:hypothetical protein
LQAALPTIDKYRERACGKKLRGKPKQGFEPSTPLYESDLLAIA